MTSNDIFSALALTGLVSLATAFWVFAMRSTNLVGTARSLFSPRKNREEVLNALKNGNRVHQLWFELLSCPICLANWTSLFFSLFGAYETNVPYGFVALIWPAAAIVAYLFVTKLGNCTDCDKASKALLELKEKRLAEKSAEKNNG